MSLNNVYKGEGSWNKRNFRIQWHIDFWIKFRIIVISSYYLKNISWNHYYDINHSNSFKKNFNHFISLQIRREQFSSKFQYIISHPLWPTKSHLPVLFKQEGCFHVHGTSHRQQWREVINIQRSCKVVILFTTRTWTANTAVGAVCFVMARSTIVLLEKDSQLLEELSFWRVKTGSKC